jgi:general secretion pathway protein I
MNVARIAHGFTLLEVLVALVIVAFGMGALMATLTSAATSVERLREKSFAEWVALNRISEVRLGKGAPTKGKSNGESELGGLKWKWTQEIQEANFPGMLRIDVRVTRAGAPGTDEPMELAAAEGFIGLGGTLARNSGNNFDWTLETAKATAQPPPGTNPPGTGTPANPGGTTSPPSTPPPPRPISNPASTL